MALIALGSLTTAALPLTPGPHALLAALSVTAGMLRGNLTLLQATPAAGSRLFPAQHVNLNVLGRYSFRASVPAAARARCAITTRPGSTMTMRKGCASASAR